MLQYLLQPGHKCLFGYKQQSIHDIKIKYTFYIYPEKKVILIYNFQENT
jgi:hypothetical protein